MAKPIRRPEIPDDPAAFEKRYRAKIHSVLRRAMFPGLPSDALNDIYQEYFVKVLANWEWVQRRDNVEGSIIKMARNVLFDYARRHDVNTNTGRLALRAKRQPTKGDPTFDEAARNERDQKLRESYRKLSPAKQKILWERAEGKSQVRVGDDLDMTRKQVAKTEADARRQIQRDMKPFMDDPPP